MNDWLEIQDHGERLRIGFDDLLKYHGRSSIGGVAIGFKAMQRAFELLSPQVPPARGDLHVLTAFPGPGARDAFEMVTRVVTAGAYRVELDCAPPEVPEAPRGRYYFRVGYGEASVDLSVRPGLVRGEFIELLRRKAHAGLGDAQEAHLVELKREMAERLLGMPAAEVYAVLE